LGEKIFVQHFSELFFEFGSKTQSSQRFGINLAVTNDFIVDGVAEKLALFVGEIYYVWYFQPKRRAGNPAHRWNSSVNKTTQVQLTILSIDIAIAASLHLIHKTSQKYPQDFP